MMRQPHRTTTSWLWVGMLLFPLSVSGCWEKVSNPYLAADPGMEQALCGSCVWLCLGDTCGAANCNDGDYDGDGNPDCRCEMCGVEYSDKVFDSTLAKCVNSITDEDGNVITADGTIEFVCEGKELDTNYLGGDCNCLDEDPVVSRDGLYLEGISEPDNCVRKCNTYGAEYFVYQSANNKCWCKTEEGYNNPVRVAGSIAGTVSAYLENCAEPLPEPLTDLEIVAIAMACFVACLIAGCIGWVLWSNKSGTYCCC